MSCEPSRLARDINLELAFGIIHNVTEALGITELTENTLFDTLPER